MDFDAELERARERIIFRPWERLAQAKPARTTRSWQAPETLLARMAAAYRSAESAELHDAGSFWEDYFSTHQRLPDEALVAGDIRRIRDLWRHPISTPISGG
jgi:thioesterase domain-containing protein